MPLDPVQTTHFVLQVLDAWLLKNTGTGFKSGKTIPDNPPRGYAISRQRYLKLCDDMTTTLVNGTGRSFKLSKAWRDANYPDEVEVFVAEVTRVLLAANLMARGRRLAAIAANIDVG